MIELYPQEEVIFETRRHWYVLIVETLVFALLGVVPLIVLPFAAAADFFASYENALVLYIFATCVWLLFMWILFFVAWTNYYLDALVITDRRVVVVEQHGLFSREVAECSLESVEDITIQIVGFLVTLLRFGDLHVQTAAEAREFVFRHVGNPEKIKAIIFKECMHHSRHKKDAESANLPIADEVAAKTQNS